MAIIRPIWRQSPRQACLLAALMCIITTVIISTSPFPHLTIDYGPPPYNASKLALLIENRPLPILAPLTLHFISVIPPDWRFLFIGSPDSLAALNRSAAVRHHVAAGKLDLMPIPANMSTDGQEMISQFLTTLWLYETALWPAEWVLVFQTDSVVCANSKVDVDDFLGYDWVGAPWNPTGQWGGNGGLSLRRVSRILDVLRNQKRANDSEPEDVWLAERLGHHPLAKVANGSVSLTFSGEMHSGVPERVGEAGNLSTVADRNHGKIELDGDNGNDNGSVTEYVRGIDDWRAGFYEPMGYHTGGSGRWLHGPIWGSPALREHIYKYCPEVKMTLAMDMARYVPGSCAAVWAI